jgi:RHS repeat-associated protein
MKLLSSLQRCVPIGGGRGRRRRVSPKSQYGRFYGVVSSRRYYSPSTGRWLSRDPINEPDLTIFTGGKWRLSLDAEVNLYKFVANDPLNKVDADGRDTWVPYPPPGHYVSDPPKLPPYPSDPRGSPGNCYNYACNLPPSPDFPYPILYPGQRAGLPDLSATKGWNCDVVKDRAKADFPNDPNIGSPQNGKCANGYHAIRPEVTTDGSGFHFKRYDPATGVWSEKKGNLDRPATCNQNKPGYKGDIQCPDICVPD